MNQPWPVEPDPAQPGRPDAELTVGYANSIEEALIQARQCDVVLVSAMLPDERALTIVQTLAQTAPRVRILMKDLVEARRPLLPYLEAGATGWML
jgi:DNA-binding NarL/FixJ family response regulator